MKDKKPTKMQTESELASYGFSPSNEETETTVIWKDKGNRSISVLKDYEKCPPFLKELHLQKLQSLHAPHPCLFEQAYDIEEI